MEVKPGYKQTEVGVIPEEWEVKPLGQIAQLKNGYAFKSETYDPLGDFRIITIANVQDGFMDATECSRIVSLPSDLQPHQRLRVGDILISMTGNVGRVCRVTEPSCLLNQRVGKLMPTGFDSDLFFLLLGQRRFISLMATKAKGGAQGNLSVTDITEFQFAVPRTEPEQRAIAEVLSDADGLLGGLDRLIAKKRDLKQAAMQQLLTGQTRLPGFHGEWEVKRLGSVLHFQVGFPFSSSFFNKDSDGVRLVKNRDLKSDDQVYHYSGKYDPEFLVSNGDVLVGMDGDFLPCPWMKGPALLNQRVGRIVPLAGMNREFAFYYLLEPLKEIEATTSSTTVKHLSHGDIEDIEKPLPCEAEQTAIAEVLTAMDAELAGLEQRREKTCALKQAMMQELLTGRTRLVCFSPTPANRALPNPEGSQPLAGG